jgi:hypothetical protein
MNVDDLPENPPGRHSHIISLARMSLTRVYEQNRQREQRREGAKPPELAPEPATKAKPRLLLMGQRRYGLKLHAD